MSLEWTSRFHLVLFPAQAVSSKIIYSGLRWDSFDHFQGWTSHDLSGHVLLFDHPNSKNSVPWCSHEDMENKGGTFWCLSHTKILHQKEKHFINQKYLVNLNCSGIKKILVDYILHMFKMFKYSQNRGKACFLG